MDTLYDDTLLCGYLARVRFSTKTMMAWNSNDTGSAVIYTDFTFFLRFILTKRNRTKFSKSKQKVSILLYAIFPLLL